MGKQGFASHSKVRIHHKRGDKDDAHLFSRCCLFQTLLASLLVLLPLLEKGFWDLDVLVQNNIFRPNWMHNRWLDVPTETVGTLYSQWVSF